MRICAIALTLLAVTFASAGFSGRAGTGNDRNLRATAVLFFREDGCVACLKQKKVLDTLKATHRTFDAPSESATSWNVTAEQTPVLIFVKEGKQMLRLDGFQSEAKVRDVLESLK